IGVAEAEAAELFRQHDAGPAERAHRLPLLGREADAVGLAQRAQARHRQALLRKVGRGALHELLLLRQDQLPHRFPPLAAAWAAATISAHVVTVASMRTVCSST